MRFDKLTNIVEWLINQFVQIESLIYVSIMNRNSFCTILLTKPYTEGGEHK